jgi:hypothetical protein
VDESYQECAADNDKDTTGLVAGLRVDGGNLVLNALEGKFLCSHFRISHSCPASSMTYNPCFSRSWWMSRTWSLETMLAVPRKGDCSKVSMEFSRYMGRLARLHVAVSLVISR